MPFPDESPFSSIPPPISSIPPPLVAPRGDKRVIAVGGGRGGVGKSLLAVNLAVYLAQLGRSVVIVDADPVGANLHVMLGLDRPPVPTKEQREANEPFAVETSVPGLRLLGTSAAATALSVVRPAVRRFRHSRQLLHQLACDYAVVDLGAGASTTTLDLFAWADVGICVTAPEPPAIEATYHFLRALFLRRLRLTLGKERFKLRMVERAVEEIGPFPAPLEIIHTLARYDGALAALASGELRRVIARLVVNTTRVRADVDLGPAMQFMTDRFLGVNLDYIGHIEQDDAVWLTVRRRRPLLIDSPTCKSARHIERIARRIVALTAVREPAVPPMSIPPPEDRRWTLYDVLGVSRGASDEEVRRAAKRHRELFAPGSLPLCSLFDERRLQSEQSQIEEAHDTLLDPVRRRAYDVSTFPETSASEPPPPHRLWPEPTEEQQLLQAELAREIHSATEFSGAFLRKIRESQGIELVDIATRTKIALTHLQAIEEESFGELPAIVYTRGFVREIAKTLKLDPSQVDRTYLKRLRADLASRGRPTE